MMFSTIDGKKILWLLLFSLLLCGSVIMSGCVRWADGKIYDIAALNANPILLSGISLQDGRLEGLKIENVTLHNTTFKNIILDEPVFKNVIFEDCNFTKSHFYGSTFENVVFKSGSMSSGIFNRNDYARTKIDGLFNNVIFDDINLSDAEIDITTKNKVLFKNITEKVLDSSANISGSGNIYIDSCSITGEQFVSTHNNAKIYAKNSSFVDSGFGGSKAEVIYAENCTFTLAYLGKAKTLVVKNSKFRRSNIKAQEKMFLVNNEYDKADGIAINPGKNAQVYVAGNNKQAQVNIFGGNVHIYDLEILDSTITTAPGRDYIPINSLNLKNVTLRSGDWADLKLKGGQWENVQIYPPVDITNAKIENLKGYNVTFPEGTPWTGKSAGGASMTVSKTPFEWPEVHVPTPEELGLLWDWPEITGAPEGK